MEDREAAAILQRIGRGYVGRRKGVEEVLAKLKVQKMMKRVRFARRIQPLCKAYLARRDLVKNLKEEAERPIKIMQRFGRAFRTRRIFCKDLAEWKAKRLNAIKTVEAYCRGQRSSRRRAIQFRRAALRIAQCLGRGFLCRRNDIQEIILKRIRKRTRQITLLQSCGRAMLVRTDCKYQRRAQLLQRKKVFVFETQRFWRAFRIRLRLGRRWNVISRANRMRLATLCQRVGQGHFERLMIEPRYRLKKHTDMLSMCATLIQQCGRGMRARTWVGYRFDTAQRRIRKNRIRRETELSAALTLARIGRAFQRRRKCFRRFFKFMKAKRILASVAVGAIARQRLRSRYHVASLRVRARPETPEGDDEKALRALKKINQDLRDELMEDQWKIDSLITAGIAQHVPVEILKRKMASRGSRNPEEVYRKRCKQFARANEILRARLAVRPPEYLASLTAKLTTAESERAKVIRENRKLEAQIDAHAPDVKDAEEELTALEDTRKKEQAVVDRAKKRTLKAEAVAALELVATTKLEEEIEAMIEKLEAVQEFEDEDRPPSARALRRRATARRLEASRMSQSMTSVVGSPTNAARRLAASNSSITPPPVLRAGERSIDAHPAATKSAKAGGEGDDEANRLTYHFDSDEEHLDLQPPQRAKSSMELSQSNRGGGGGPAKHRSLRLNASQMSASRGLVNQAGGPVFASPSAKKQNLVDAHYGVCVPMVARMSYAGIPGASVNTTSAAALRGTSLVGSPVRSIRIKPKTQGAGMHQLEPELPALADSFNSWTVREPSALIPAIGSEPTKRDTASVSFATASPAGTTKDNEVADAFEPHVVVRTQQDMVYAKVQLQEAEAKIASLRHDIDRAEHALTEMERRVEVKQRERAADAKRKEKQQRKSASEETKRALQREEDERLQKRLETLQAIAKAEQDAADAAARRAEAEAKLREELARPREKEGRRPSQQVPPSSSGGGGGTSSRAASVASSSAKSTPPPQASAPTGASSEAAPSLASSKRSSAAASEAPAASSTTRKTAAEAAPAPKRSSGDAAAAAKKGAKSAAEARPRGEKKTTSQTQPAAPVSTLPPAPAPNTERKPSTVVSEPAVTSGAPSAQTSPPPDASIVPNTTAPPPHAADEYSDDEFADEADDDPESANEAAPAAAKPPPAVAAPATRSRDASDDGDDDIHVEDDVATPSLGSSIGSSIPPTPSDLSQSM